MKKLHLNYSILLTLFLTFSGAFSLVSAQTQPQSLNLPGGNVQALATVTIQGEVIQVAGLTGSPESPLIPISEGILPNPLFSGFLFEEVASIARNSANNNVLVGSGNGGVHQFDVAQELWRTLRPETGGGRTQVGVTDNSTIVAATEFFGINRSIDGGQTFLPAQNPPGMSFIGDMATKGDTVLLGGFPGVFISTDAGNTFVSTSFPFVPVSEVDIDPSTCTIYVGTFTDGLYRSVDDGNTFQKVSSVTPLNGWVTAINANGGPVYVSVVGFPEDFSRTFTSVDDGATFTELPASDDKDIVNDFLVVDDTTFFGTTGAGLTKSVNNSAPVVLQRAESNHNTTAILIPDDSTLVVGNNTGGIYKADIQDPTATWKKLDNSNLIDVTAATSDQFGNSYFVGTSIVGPEVRYLEAGSDSMAKRINGITSPFIQSIAVSDSTGTLLVGGEEMFRSSDQGLSYTSSNKPQGFISDMIYVTDTNKFIAQSNFGLYESTNDGNSWSQYTDPIFTSEMVASPQGTSFAFVARDTVYRATGMGDVEALDDGFPNGRRALDIDISDDGQLIAIVAKNPNVGVYEYMESANIWQETEEWDSGFEFINDFKAAGVFAPSAQPGVTLNPFVGVTGKGVFGMPTLTGIGNEDIFATPQIFVLDQNYPNPFNPETTIRYQLNQPGNVQLIIYNTLGQKIATLINELQIAGTYQVRWNGRDAVGLPVSSGVYLYQLSVGSELLTRQMLLVK